MVEEVKSEYTQQVVMADGGKTGLCKTAIHAQNSKLVTQTETRLFTTQEVFDALWKEQ